MSTEHPSPDPTPRAAEQPSGRDRLWQAFTRPGRAQVVVAALLAVLGFSFVVQVKDYQREDAYAGLRESELIQVLDGLTGTADRAEREVSRLEKRRDELRSESSARQAAVDLAEERVQTLNILSGTIPVTGPGLKVTITEESGTVSVGSLLDVVEELRTAGAEAMEFNNKFRLVAQSWFNQTDEGISLDGHLLESPYVIEVIGDPYNLEGGLVFRSGPIETLETYDGAKVTVEQVARVDITSVREPLTPESALPVEGQ